MGWREQKLPEMSDCLTGESSEYSPRRSTDCVFLMWPVRLEPVLSSQPCTVSIQLPQRLWGCYCLSLKRFPPMYPQMTTWQKLKVGGGEANKALWLLPPLCVSFWISRLWTLDSLVVLYPVPPTCIRELAMPTSSVLNECQPGGAQSSRQGQSRTHLLVYLASLFFFFFGSMVNEFLKISFEFNFLLSGNINHSL